MIDASHQGFLSWFTTLLCSSDAAPICALSCGRSGRVCLLVTNGESMIADGCRTLERLDIRLSGVAEDEEVAIADTLLNRLREQALKK